MVEVVRDEQSQSTSSREAPAYFKLQGPHPPLSYERNHPQIVTSEVSDVPLISLPFHHFGT